SSVASTLAPPGASVYAASKAAVNTITKVLAKELGPRKIRVNSVSPGPVATEGYDAAGVTGSDFEKQAIAMTPPRSRGATRRHRARRGVPRLGGCALDHRRDRLRFGRCGGLIVRSAPHARAQSRKPAALRGTVSAIDTRSGTRDRKGTLSRDGGK